ncbi:hypothetical protein CLAFUW4_10203 [Fulvia fulva]|nr:hypothetical protein CLAFUR4_10207 [Fulvia fulva]KAK4617005.1 hypothetical protein CLAFUR0_10205 [Fulvia fulva]WPV18776.1 hypothetical protein CLAFUW4_10203 [Fulvia fulva]WPV34119.1 hypothetical protein CLAFUW7_10203 [Fulvia fulva]
MTAHWLDKKAADFADDHFQGQNTENFSGILMHIIIFDTRRIIMLHPKTPDERAEIEQDVSDIPRTASLTVHSIELAKGSTNGNLTMRDYVLEALGSAIQTDLLRNVQISEYCCDRYLHEVRVAEELELETLHLAVQVTIQPPTDDGRLNHNIRRRTSLTFDPLQIDQYNDAFWLPLPRGPKASQHKKAILAANNGSISTDLLTKTILRHHHDTSRNLFKKRFPTVPKMAARLRIIFTACFDIENLRRGHEMGYILAWRHAPFGQLVVFIVNADVVEREVEQVDHGEVRYDVLFSGMRPGEGFLEGAGLDVEALGMMVGGTRKDEDDYCGGRVLFEWMTEDEGTRFHYRRL